MDEGLLIGLAEGLKSTLTSYSDAADKRYRREIEAKKLQKDEEERTERLGLLKEQRQIEKARSGLIRDAEGNLVEDPNSFAIKKQAAELKAAENKGLLDAASLEKTRAETGKIRAEAKEPGGKPPTADQFKVGGFAKRLEQAEQVFSDLAKSGYNRSDIKQGLLAANPTNVGKNSGLQKQEQAERNFLTAVLRRESGASISPTEMKTGEQQYFDRPGDTPELKAQKRANRLQVLESLKAEAGGAYSRIPTVEVPQSRSAEDQEAINWANANPNDPRSLKIKQRLGL